MSMAPREPRVDALADMPLADLRSAWQSLCKAPAPRISRSLLTMALGYEMQARERGGLTKPARAALAAAISGKAVSTRSTTAGSRLVRSWGGRAYVVEIGEGGIIRWNDQTWTSLSAVARAITRTRWSGPAIFGLTDKRAAA